LRSYLQFWWLKNVAIIQIPVQTLSLSQASLYLTEFFEWKDSCIFECRCVNACCVCTFCLSIFHLHFKACHFLFSKSLLVPTISWVTRDVFRAAASNYLRKAGETHGTVEIHISVGKLLKYAWSMKHTYATLALCWQLVLNYQVH
jgi:hypothetical protein